MTGDPSQALFRDRGVVCRLVASALLAASSVVLRQVFARHGTRFFPAYRVVSKTLMGTLAHLASVVPFALWDIALLLTVVAVAFLFVHDLRRHKSVLPLVSWLCLVLSVTFAVAVDGWALNHYAPSLADEMGLEVRAYSTGELATATEHYLLEAAQLAPRMERDSTGNLVRQDFFELARIAGSSYEELGERHDVFEGSSEPVKALLVWGEPLLLSGHTGIFWAATGESGVPLNSAIADEPFIMCHEAAHRLGLASEQEANFAAYLACEHSADERLTYSGYYNAFVYCFDALYGADPEAATELLERAASSDAGVGVKLVWADRLATHEHYAAYDGPFKKVGTSVNDTYLKSFGEASGVRSYGLVVDYLIAWYQK